jgi:hypothetical protein
MSQFVEHEHDKYCLTCYKGRFGRRCAECKQICQDVFISACGALYHQGWLVVFRNYLHQLHFNDVFVASSARFAGSCYCEHSLRKTSWLFAKNIFTWRNHKFTNTLNCLIY